MNSLLNVSEASRFSECPEVLDDASVLNNNVDFSQLDISLAHTEKETSVTQTSAKLSITLEPEERAQLNKAKGRQIQSNSSVMKITTDLDNVSMASTETTLANDITNNHEISIDEGATTDNSLAKHVSKITDVSMAIQEVDEEDESVIPIEDDEETETDASTMNETQTSLKQQLPIDMFSHLQPNTTQDKSILPEMEVEDDVSVDKLENAIAVESFVELEPSILLPDESEYFQKPFVELGRRLWPSTTQQQCYTKGCQWSPDGTCLLVPVHMDGMHVIELPTDLYTTQELDTERELSALNSAVHVKEGGMVYDAVWYPFMNSTDPATCCWLATRQHEPIHMWDAFTGELRCSYRGYDDVDEVESAISIAFSNDGQKVVGGYKKTIKIFDTNIPGRVYTSIRVKQTVSCFAFTTENDNCVTTGSWNSHIYHYDLRAPKLGPLFTLGGHKGGITWLKYSTYNTDNWYLFSGARMDDKILQWDMRNYQEPVKSFERRVQTNQRISFDLSPMHKWLISGDTTGSLRIWDMDEKQEKIELPLHADCCNGVSFHPSLPILSTSSGQYHFPDKSDAPTDKLAEPAKEKIINYENSVMFLWFGPSKS